MQWHAHHFAYLCRSDELSVETDAYVLYKKFHDGSTN